MREQNKKCNFLGYLIGLVHLDDDLVDAVGDALEHLEDAGAAERRGVRRLAHLVAELDEVAKVRIVAEGAMRGETREEALESGAPLLDEVDGRRVLLGGHLHLGRADHVLLGRRRQDASGAQVLLLELLVQREEVAEAVRRRELAALEHRIVGLFVEFSSRNCSD